MILSKKLLAHEFFFDIKSFFSETRKRHNESNIFSAQYFYLFLSLKGDMNNFEMMMNNFEMMMNNSETPKIE